MIKLYKSIHNYICQHIADYYFYSKFNTNNKYSRESAMNKYFYWIEKKFRD